MCLDGVWGTVRDVMWDDNDARVVCRELGYSGHSELLMAIALVLNYCV